MATNYKSGSSKKIRKIQFSFYEYKNISSVCVDSIPEIVKVRLKEFNEEPIKVQQADAPVLVDNKWIYVFKRDDQKISIFSEFKTTASDGAQSFKCVSWDAADRKTNLPKYPRPTAGKTLDKFYLDSGVDYYILLSQIQLPLERIDFYIQNTAKLAMRSLHIPAELPLFKDPVVNMFLVDYQAVSVALSQEFVKAVGDFEAFAQDPEEVNNRYLANLVCMIEKSRPKIRDWLDFDKVAAYNEEQSHRLNRREREKKKAEGRLKSWKLLPAYQLMLKESNGYKEIEENIIKHEASVTFSIELGYLSEVAADKDSWYSQIFLNEEPFLFHRKLTALAANDFFNTLISKYFTGKLLALLPVNAIKVTANIEKIAVVQVKIIKEYSLFLKRVYAANPSKIPFKLQNNGEFFILAIDEYTKQIRIRYEFNVTVQTKKTYSVDDSKLVKARKEWKENVEKASAICKIILIPIELYNLKTSYEAISGAKTNEERGFAKIDFLGSVCDNMSGVFEVMGENVEKEFGKKLANRLTGAVSIVGAVCDYVGAMHKILKASGEGKHGVTAGNALIALSAVASAASTAVLITDVAVFGLAAGPLGLIGVGLFVVGAAVVWYFTEEPLEEWAKASMWGKKFKHSTIEQQIHDLHEVLAAFDVACYLYKEEGQQYASENGYYSDYNYYFTLRINPGMFNEKVSKYNINLAIVQKQGILFSNKPILTMPNLLLPDNETQIIKAGDGSARKLIKRFKADDYVLADNEHTFAFTCKAQIDLSGDGKEKIPSSGPLSLEGDMKPVGMDL